jgi:hypothetical protein
MKPDLTKLTLAELSDAFTWHHCRGHEVQTVACFVELRRRYRALEAQRGDALEVIRAYANGRHATSFNGLISASEVQLCADVRAALGSQSCEDCDGTGHWSPTCGPRQHGVDCKQCNGSGVAP